ncbi:hypothetical protein ACWGCW_31540 [Streptomyces sp. NPDC054933]
MARRNKAATNLSTFVRQAGTDPRKWTPEQRAQHSRLVTATQHAEIDAARPTPKRRWLS